MAFNANLAGGPYNLSYGGSDVGLMEEPPSVETIPLWEWLKLSHTYAESRLDGLFRGVDVSINAVLRYWNSTTKGLIWPFGTWGTPGTHGRDAYTLAGAVVLTAVAGTPAATAGPASVTFAKCIIESMGPVTYGPTWRIVPVRLAVMLDGSANFFTST